MRSEVGGGGAGGWGGEGVRPPLRVASMPERLTDQQLFSSSPEDW